MILVNYLKTQKQIVTQLRLLTSYVNTPSLIKDILEKHVEKPNLQSMRQEVLESSDKRRINEDNVDFLILSNCQNPETRKLGVEYVRNLRESGTELNLAASSKLLQIYGMINYMEPDADPMLEEEIVKLYGTLTEKYKILDVSLTESVVIALSTTSRWQECWPLLKQLQVTTTPTGATYDSIIVVLFKHNETDRAWQLLQEMVDLERRPASRCYLSYLSMLTKAGHDYKTFVTEVEKLFEFWSTNDILIRPIVATRVTEAFATYNKGKVALGSINPKGECAKCKRQLPATTFKDDDFKQLTTAFFDRVIVGKDVFRKTTPGELETFKRFVEEKQHYDVIIDGLNVAYSAGVRKSLDITSGLVTSVVQHYARQNKSVLVLGRNHMKQWPNIRTIRQNARLFLTQNLSQDDPYLLYCALNSGRGTIIVSRDLMRGHLYLLKEPHLKQLFKRWLSTTQHKLISVRQDGALRIKAPPCYIQSAQKHNNVWHLPCESDARNVQLNLNAQQQKHFKPEPTLWLCIQL